MCDSHYDHVQTGLRMRSLRMRRGFSLSELSSESGVAEASLAGFEDASREMTFEDAYKISKVLGVSLEELILRNSTSKRISAPLSKKAVSMGLESMEDGCRSAGSVKSQSQVCMVSATAGNSYGKASSKAVVAHAKACGSDGLEGSEGAWR